MNIRLSKNYLKLAAVLFYFEMSTVYLVISQAPRPSDHDNSQFHMLDTNALGFLEAGAWTNEIASKLGPPHSILFATSADSCWIYNTALPNHALSPGSGSIIGIQIWITNGQVKAWNYLVATAANSPGVTALPLGFSNEPPIINLYLVSETNIPDGKMIQMQNPQGQGYISGRPSITITAINGLDIDEDVYAENHDTVTNWAFTLVLTEPDSDQFSKLTEQNVGKRVVIAVGDKPLFAPIIGSHITSGRLTIHCSDPSVMSQIRSMFLKMKLPKTE